MELRVKFEAERRYKTWNKHPNELMSEEGYEESSTVYDEIMARADDLAQVWKQNVTARIDGEILRGVYGLYED